MFTKYQPRDGIAEPMQESLAAMSFRMSKSVSALHFNIIFFRHSSTVSMTEGAGNTLSMFLNFEPQGATGLIGKRVPSPEFRRACPPHSPEALDANQSIEKATHGGVNGVF